VVSKLKEYHLNFQRRIDSSKSTNLVLTTSLAPGTKTGAWTLDENMGGKENCDRNMAPIPGRSLSLRLALSLQATSHQLAPSCFLARPIFDCTLFQALFNMAISIYIGIAICPGLSLNMTFAAAEVEGTNHVKQLLR
jgi:hypothetical protein